MLFITIPLIISLTVIIRQQIGNKQSAQAHQIAQDTAGIREAADAVQPVQSQNHTKAEKTPPPAEAPSASQSPAEQAAPEPNAHEQMLLGIDLQALQKVNDQVKGWICIPDTEISYPLVQGTDNDYYLNHTWNFEWSSAGSIFLEHMVNSDLTDFNTLIYGHRMNNGTMFSPLKEYRAAEFWEEHPCVYLSTNYGVACYRVYAAYEAKTDAITYGLELNSQELRDYFIAYGLAKSVIDTGIVPTCEDRVITLVTCTGNGYSARWVVQAVLDHVIPSERAESLS